MKIYLVTHGQYSDFENIAAFSSREKASDFAKIVFARPFEIFDIEEYEIDSEKLTPDVKGGFVIEMRKNGGILAIDMVDSTPDKIIDFIKDYGEIRPNIFSRVRIYERTVSRDTAVKGAQEKWAQIIAANLWGLDLANEDLSSIG